MNEQAYVQRIMKSATSRATNGAVYSNNIMVQTPGMTQDSYVQIFPDQRLVTSCHRGEYGGLDSISGKKEGEFGNLTTQGAGLHKALLHALHGIANGEVQEPSDRMDALKILDKGVKSIPKAPKIETLTERL